jgi:hypothetical protein
MTTAVDCVVRMCWLFFHFSRADWLFFVCVCVCGRVVIHHRAKLRRRLLSNNILFQPSFLTFLVSAVTELCHNSHALPADAWCGAVEEELLVASQKPQSTVQFSTRHPCFPTSSTTMME